MIFISRQKPFVPDVVTMSHQFLFHIHTNSYPTTFFILFRFNKVRLLITSFKQATDNENTSDIHAAISDTRPILFESSRHSEMLTTTGSKRPTASDSKRPTDSLPCFFSSNVPYHKSNPFARKRGTIAVDDAERTTISSHSKMSTSSHSKKSDASGTKKSTTYSSVPTASGSKRQDASIVRFHSCASLINTLSRKRELITVDEDDEGSVIFIYPPSNNESGTVR